jgi:hypothetical protein
MANRRWWEALLPRVWRPNAGLISAADALRAGARPATPAGGLSRPIPDHEHGVSGTEVFGGTISGEEYNADLQGVKGLETYDTMRRSDAQVRATLQVMKLPLRAAVWAATPPKHGDATDQAIAEFVHASLFDDDAMVDPWDSVLRHVLLQLDFGFSLTEKIWRVDDQGYYRFKRLAPRLPKTIHYWHARRDGSLVRVWQYAPVIVEDSRTITAAPSHNVPMPPSSQYQYLAIPAEVLSVFTLEREGDNYEGMSLLRAAYKHWWYKDLLYHLDSVRHDRYGVGIPTAELAENHGLTADDLDELETVLKDLRANERVFLVAPPGVRFRIMGPEAGGGTTHGAMQMIDHHDAMIARNVLAGFLTLGRDPRGTRALGSRLTDFFVASLYGIAAGIVGDLKQSIVKPLCDLNFEMRGREYPTIEVRDLESQDIDRLLELALTAIPSLITPDDHLEDWVREALKLPSRPQGTSRSVEDRIASGKKTDPSEAPTDPNAPPKAQALPAPNDAPDDEEDA